VNQESDDNNGEYHEQRYPDLATPTGIHAAAAARPADVALSFILRTGAGRALPSFTGLVD